MNLLLIEDDPSIVAALELSLTRLGYAVTTADRDPGADLPTLVHAADAVVLDIGLPGEDGFGLCRRIRTFSAVPILMLTARGDDIDMVAGLESGADDYVLKPVSPRVLDARIKANVRRVETTVEPAASSTETLGDLVLDRDAADVLRDGVSLGLSPTEKRLVFAFADHRGQVLSRDQLLRLAWDQDFLGDSRLVDNAIQRLRSKVDSTDGPSHIETVRGFGYRFVP
ncbi:response regulator transcription factor [Gordonia phthalatica]|uniref:Transcriptional regulator n=1 Tax=Gordonia phthalatica TaxID=1136941 RepID=A0A0N9MNK9_9ACTN|nr:response regulator transcription factor [Gordonia phthalatica]ALG84369.1 transcriptional regulator [Gordonia phthalatica]